MCRGLHGFAWCGDRLRVLRLTLIAVLALAFGAAPVFSQSITPNSGPNYSGQLVRIGTIERLPFSIKREDAWGGFSIELWEAIAAELNIETEYVEFTQFSSMIAAIETGMTDGAVANISVTEERERVLDFSLPIFDAGITVLTPVAGGAGDVFSVLFSRELMIWIGGALVILFLAANLIWLTERAVGGHEAFTQRGYRAGVGRGLWWAMNVLTQSSFEVASPQTRLGRFVGVAIVVFGLFVVSAFVAQITASLTVRGLTSTVSDISDLKSRRVGTTAASTSARFLDENGVGYRPYPTIEDMFAALEDDSVDVVVHDGPVLAYFARTQGAGRYQLPARAFKKEQYGMALKESSPLREDVNRSLLRMRENGSYDAIARRWFGDAY